MSKARPAQPRSPMPPTCLPQRGSFAHLQFKFTKVQIPSPITGLRDDLISTKFEAGRFQGTRKARKKERKKKAGALLLPLSLETLILKLTQPPFFDRQPDLGRNLNSTQPAFRTLAPSRLWHGLPNHFGASSNSQSSSCC